MAAFNLTHDNWKEEEEKRKREGEKIGGIWTRRGGRAINRLEISGVEVKWTGQKM